MGRWFTAWMAVVVLGVALFVIGLTRSSGIDDCTYDAGVSTYDANGVPVQGACVASGDSDDGLGWDAATWIGAALVLVGIVGTVLSALRSARRMVERSFADVGIDRDVLARLGDLADVLGDDPAHRPHPN